MKCRSAIWFWIVALSGLTLPRLFAARDVPVNIVVDFTPEGRKLVHPTRAAPAYYFPVASGFQELGSPVGGEVAPEQEQVLHSIALGLAGQGYLLTRPGYRTNDKGELTYADGTTVRVPANPYHRARSQAEWQVPLTTALLNSADGSYSLSAALKNPRAPNEGPPPILRALRMVDPVHGGVMDRMPSLILLINYGYMNPNVVELGQGQKIVFNENLMLSLVGGKALDHMVTDFEREDIMQAAEEDRYFIMVTAYDYKVYAATRKKVMLWQAKVSTPTRGISKFSDVDLALVSAGTGSFGRETVRPVTCYLHRTPDGKVDVGPLTVTGVSEAGAPSPTPNPQP
jgi:hypothetical protein